MTEWLLEQLTRLKRSKVTLCSQDRPSFIRWACSEQRRDNASDSGARSSMWAHDYSHSDGSDGSQISADCRRGAFVRRVGQGRLFHTPMRLLSRDKWSNRKLSVWFKRGDMWGCECSTEMLQRKRLFKADVFPPNHHNVYIKYIMCNNYYITAMLSSSNN